MIGVIGGMGPLATVDFMAKVIEVCGAADDADHVPMLVSCDPRVPGRPAAMLRGGPSPLPALRAIRDRLVAAGATALVMPCNTAHHWFDGLVDGCPVPFLSIVDAGCDEAAKASPAGARIAVLATPATLAARLFDAGLEGRGLVPVVPAPAELERWLSPSIAAVKAGRLQDASALLRGAMQAMADRGVDRFLLACTELPLALAAGTAPVPWACVDTNLALARVTVAHWQRSLQARAA